MKFQSRKIYLLIYTFLNCFMASNELLLLESSMTEQRESNKHFLSNQFRIFDYTRSKQLSEFIKTIIFLPNKLQAFFFEIQI